MLTTTESHLICELLDAEINRLLAVMKARQRHTAVMVMGTEVPSYRLDELRWQKIEFLLSIRAKLIPSG